MNQDIEKLTFEVEKIIGKPLVPIIVNKRVYWTPLVVLLFLLVVRPNFVYNSEKKFKIHLLIWYTLLISIVIIGGFFAYQYRRFF